MKREKNINFDGEATVGRILNTPLFRGEAQREEKSSEERMEHIWHR
jgi:hypothetical protein